MWVSEKTLWVSEKTLQLLPLSHCLPDGIDGETSVRIVNSNTKSSKYRLEGL